MANIGKRLRSGHGFTVVEQLAVLAIFGMVITALYTFYLAGLNSYNRSFTRLEGQQSARIAMDKIVRELRYAASVEVVSGEEILFHLPDDHRVYRFRKSGREIVFESLFGRSIIAHTKVALGINSLHFAVGQTCIVNITIAAGAGDNELILTSRIRPRNMPGSEAQHE